MRGIHDFLRRCVEVGFRLFRISCEQRQIDAVVQFLEFCAVGVTNTLISYGLNVLVLLLLKPFAVSWDYLAGNIVAFILSVLWSFYWNNKYVFRENQGQRKLWKALLKTYISYSFTGLILSNLVSYVSIEWLGVSKFIAPLINLVISVPINFLINKFWAFKAD